MKVFFSWQADLPQAASTRLIRRCLTDAASELAHERESAMEVVEATSGNPGSPYIPSALAEKIRLCDIFVGDVTTVARIEQPLEDKRGGKSLPNPNVTFELGLAAAHVGWDRVIMLFNEGLAAFDQLPFDFDRHRITKFTVTAEAAGDKAKRLELTKTIKLALKTIVDANPARPRELEGKTPEETRHARDVANIKALFRQLSLNFLHMHLREMPDRRHFFVAWMYDGAHAVIDSPAFDLYDTG